MMELATLIISSASFMTGSARGLYGSGSGDSSAIIDKMFVRSYKINVEAKIQKLYLCTFRVQELLRLV
jgi:hypothetical protein